MIRYFFILGLSFLSLSCLREQQRHNLRDALGDRKYGGTYRLNMVRGNPNGLDPVIISSKLADDIALQIYDRLVSFDSSLILQPELAKEWTISPDGTEYIFHLRTDVFFQDDECFISSKGRRMVANDVVYSLTRCCDPRTRSVAYWVFKDKVVGANGCYESLLKSQNPNTVASVSGIQCPNDSTLIIKLIHPYSPFLMQLSNALGCVVAREAIEHYGKDYFRHPVGSGAFILHSWKDDHEMVLRRNPHYWKIDKMGNRLPFFDEVKISFITDDKVQFQEFQSMNLDESFTIPTEMFNVIFNPETKRPRKVFPFSIQQKPAMLSWFVDFLCTKAPFNDVEVRRAFSYAIDREKLVRYVLRNAPYQAATHGITPPVMPGYTIEDIPGFGFDPKLARECMKRAGYENGFDFPEVTLSVYPEPRLLQVAESVQNMLEENLNIHVRIKVYQFAQLLDMAEAGKLMMWGTRWYGDYPDVENYVSLWDGSLVPTDSLQPSYPNSTRYTNMEMSAVFANAVQTTDVDERLRLYKKAESLASKDAPAIMLFYEMHYRLLQNYVRNYPLDALNRMQLKEAWFAY